MHIVLEASFWMECLLPLDNFEGLGVYQNICVTMSFPFSINSIESTVMQDTEMIVSFNNE